MTLSKYIIGKSLFFEVVVTNEKNEINLWVVTSGKDGVQTEQKTFAQDDSLEKWKHHIAVVSISGELVVSKLYVHNDPAISKITGNDELLQTVVPAEENNECVISFLRKDVVEEFTDQLEKNNIHVLDIWIGREKITDREKYISAFYQKEMTFPNIRKAPGRMNILCDIVYYKLRLPVLLLFFCLLLGNFFINTGLRKEYESIQTEVNLKRRNDKAFQENQKKRNRLQAEYQKIPNCSFSLISDRIASYVPTGIQLNVLSIFPPERTRSSMASREKGLKLKNGSIMVKGEVEIPGSVTLFTQFLSNDHLFSKVEILSLSRQKDSGLFDFELQITL